MIIQQQQSQMGYPALLQSACLPPSVANPPTTLPPQYDTNFSQSYSPSLSTSLQSFGCAAAGLIPPQLNQGLIAVDMPMAAAVPLSSGSQHHSKINIGGLDHHHKFMVSGPIPGALPNHEVARAIGGMGLPLVVTGQSEGGDGGGENGGYKRARKRTYSQTNQDMQGMHNLYGAILKGFNLRRCLIIDFMNRLWANVATCLLRITSEKLPLTVADLMRFSLIMWITLLPRPTQMDSVATWDDRSSHRKTTARLVTPPVVAVVSLRLVVVPVEGVGVGVHRSNSSGRHTRWTHGTTSVTEFYKICKHISPSYTIIIWANDISCKSWV